MSKRPGLTELARQAGVSLTTASRALNHHPYVSEDVRKRVLETASRMNYVPQATARKKRIGVIVNNFEDADINFYRSAMLAEIARQCGLRDWGMEIISAKNLELLEENFLRAAIFFQETALDRVTVCAEGNTRLVGINAVSELFPYVASDEKQGIALAVDYFVRRGMRRIGLLMPHMQDVSPHLVARVEAFCAACAKHGLPSGRNMFGYVREDTEEEVARLLQKEKVDALLIAGEDMAYRVHYALYKLGVAVPLDVSLISFESADSSEFMTPPHTTIGQNFEALVTTALDLVEPVLEGGDVDKKFSRFIPYLFHERESVADKNSKTMAKE